MEVPYKDQYINILHRSTDVASNTNMARMGAFERLNIGEALQEIPDYSFGMALRYVEDLHTNRSALEYSIYSTLTRHKIKGMVGYQIGSDVSSIIQKNLGLLKNGGAKPFEYRLLGGGVLDNVRYLVKGRLITENGKSFYSFEVGVTILRVD